MKLIVGLGNPGNEYESTRHNAGFWVLNNLAKSLDADWQNSRKHKAHICTCQIGGHKTILAKPQTFMNLSGESVLSLMQYYKADAKNTLITHDELDLAPGCFVFTEGGSAAGHNGVKSIYELTGKKFPRLRIGIGRPPKPGPPAKDWVLQKPSAPDNKLIKQAIKDSGSAIIDWINLPMTEAMNNWNRHKKLPETNVKQ